MPPSVREGPAGAFSCASAVVRHVVESEPVSAVEAAQFEAEPASEFRPLWGTRATLWQWLVVLGVVAVFGVLFHRITADAVAERGHDAIPEFIWQLYDWKVWPLSRFR